MKGKHYRAWRSGGLTRPTRPTGAWWHASACSCARTDCGIHATKGCGNHTLKAWPGNVSHMMARQSVCLSRRGLAWQLFRPPTRLQVAQISWGAQPPGVRRSGTCRLSVLIARDAKNDGIGSWMLTLLNGLKTYAPGRRDLGPHALRQIAHVGMP